MVPLSQLHVDVSGGGAGGATFFQLLVDVAGRIGGLGHFFTPSGHWERGKIGLFRVLSVDWCVGMVTFFGVPRRTKSFLRGCVFYVHTYVRTYTYQNRFVV